MSSDDRLTQLYVIKVKCSITEIDDTLNTVSGLIDLSDEQFEEIRFDLTDHGEAVIAIVPFQMCEQKMFELSRSGLRVISVKN